MPRHSVVCGLLVAVLAVGVSGARTATQDSDLRVSITQLGDFDYARRMNAARAIRRVSPAQAVPALVDAITKHADEFVRARAFVLLTGFNDRQTADVARAAIRDRNDRLREVAYEWFAQHPDPELTATLLASLETEQAEFVRPALIRALSVLDADNRVRSALVREVGRGLDIFRGAVIEALALRRARYAVDVIAAVAALDGPLQDDAVLALGRIGDGRALTSLEEIQTKSADLRLTVHAALCLLRGDCAVEREQLIREMSVGAADSVRAAAVGLSAMAERGDTTALSELVEAARSRVGASRDDIALGLTSVALRQPALMLAWLESNPGRRDLAVAVLRDGFDMLEEDLSEEGFFAAARATYWKSADGSDMRAVTATLIDKLEF